MDIPLIIEKTEKTPEVIFDKENQVFQISGRSIIENSHEFYNPVIEWFKHYVKSPNKETELVLNYEYLNSSSSLQVMKIVFLFEANNKPESKYKITWLYERDDEMVKERGEEMKNSVNLDFDIKGYLDQSGENYEDFSFDI
jgi:hypothetical protein